MRRPWLLILLSLLVATQGSAQPTWDFRCPPAGTTASFRMGNTLGYEGSADTPILCRIAGQTTPWVLGFAGNQDPLGRALETTLQQGFFPAQVGASASLPPRPGSASGATEARFVGFEPIEVPAGTFEAAVLTFTYVRSAETTHAVRVWLDRATGVLLRYTETRGARSLDVTASAITRP